MASLSERRAATWRSRFLAAKREMEQEPQDEDDDDAKHIIEIGSPGCRQIGAVRYE